MKIAAASLLLATPFIAYASAAQNRAVGSPEPAGKGALIKQAIETRFRQLDRSADMQLGAVKLMPAQKGTSILEVTVTPPASQPLEVQAQNVYALVFDAVAQVPGAFADLARIKLSLLRSPHGMTTDCPARIVQDSLGYMTLATLRSKCVVR